MAGRFYHRSFSENVLQVGAVFVLFVLIDSGRKFL